jgi:hypothetical protein
VLYSSGTTVVLDTNTFTWTNGDLVELAITPYSDTQSLWIQRGEYSPGGAHRPSVTVSNNGSVTQQAGISLTGQSLQGGQTVAFTNGVLMANVATGVNVGSPTTAAMAIGTGLGQAPITWAGTDGQGYLAPSSTAGYFVVGPDNYEKAADGLYLTGTGTLTCILSGCGNLGLARYNGELILTGVNGNGVQGGTLRFEGNPAANEGVTSLATRDNSLPGSLMYWGGLYTEVDTGSGTNSPLRWEGYNQSSSLPSEIILPQAAATSTTNYSSADLGLESSYWNGGAAAGGIWHMMAVPGTGASPDIDLVLRYSANNVAPSGASVAVSKSTGNLELATAGAAIILKSSNGTCFPITVSNGGVLTTGSSTTCPY